MMDTDAIYSAIASRIVSSKRGDHVEAEFYQDEIKRLLNEAEEEHKSVLAENERLVDEVQVARKEISELVQKLTDKASLLRGCYARIDKLEKAVNGAIPAMREYARKNPKHYWNDAQQDPNGAHAWLAKNDGAALEKKHEGT